MPLGTCELNIKTNIKVSRQSQNWSIAMKMCECMSVCVCVSVYITALPCTYFGKYAGRLSTSHLTGEQKKAG